MELLNNIFDMHNMVILAGFFIVLLFYKLQINNKFIKEKIACCYVILFLLKMLNKISFFNLLFIFGIVSFFFLEILYKDDFTKKMMKESRYYLYDYLFTIFFHYYFLTFLISIFLVSNSFVKLMMNINFIPNNIEKNFSFIINIFPNNPKIDMFYFIGACVLMFGIKNIFNNKFKTKSFKEIFDYMEKIMPFKNFEMNESVRKLSNILIQKEDKTYFERKNTYNLISLEYARYKYIEFKNNQCKKIYRVIFIGNIVCCIHIFIKILKNIVLILIKILKNINVLLFRKKKISNIFVGHSTIEMQLIRTIALDDGYSMTFRRKVYEYVYSTIFFHSLKDYYGYFQYSNYRNYKFYLIYIYTKVAPVKINNKYYKNIYHLFNKKTLSFTNEQIYIWTLGLSHRPIDLSLLDNCPDYVSRTKLKKLLKENKFI